VPKNPLLGAYGVAPAPPTAAMLAHPERVRAFARWMQLAWVVRLTIVGVLLLLVYYTLHGI
jgi:hypothetical protein